MMFIQAMNFDRLVQSISDVHRQLQGQAVKAVNMGLTLRNWLIGAYISEYELRGEDRAAYGEALFPKLAKRLTDAGVANCNTSRLYRYRDFFQMYPQIRESGAPALAMHGKVATLLPQSEIVATLSPLSGQKERVSPASARPLVPGDRLLQRLSYSHIEMLLEIENHLIRTFYEIECIKGGWSVRELKRQIGSLYFERSGLSKDKEALSRMANEAAEPQSPTLVIRDPFIFDFLGIPAAQALSESDLEAALMNHLQAFLLELGRGFCFEARQKRLLIGGEYFFCDLVFYHRLLKCHVLIELKVDEFRHEHLGQLNTYVAWYRENEMQPGDQPPVGILLCTRQNGELVHYALGGMDQQLFVSSYKMQLPDVKELEVFVNTELNKWKEAHS